MEKEADMIMEDHEYDGIRELDNHLPPWWTYLFYLTIVFSIVYVLLYHFLDTAPLQLEEYNIEMAAAASAKVERQAEAGEIIDETNVVLATEATQLANGESIFQSSCALCHRNDGGGMVGPDLTDEYWIHGGSLKDIFSIIKYGVIEKGMVSWEAALKPEDIRDVSSFIFNLQGTNPPNPKPPQGEVYIPPEPAEEIEAEADSVATE